MSEMGGAELDFIEFDELKPGPKREIIAISEETGRTCSIRFPADWDIRDVLSQGYIIGFDGGDA